jgi:hypothetical protein
MPEGGHALAGAGREDALQRFCADHTRGDENGAGHSVLADADEIPADTIDRTRTSAIKVARRFIGLSPFDGEPSVANRLAMSQCQLSADDMMLVTAS